MNKKGFGLGLCICKIISQQFEGDIEIVSELGVGSVFSFQMKLYENVDYVIDKKTF